MSQALLLPFDSPTRWHVPASEAPPYLVDILSLEGNGECSCPHFQFRLLPLVEGEITAGTFTTDAPHRCKHITMTREAVALWLAQKPADMSTTDYFNQSFPRTTHDAQETISAP